MRLRSRPDVLGRTRWPRLKLRPPEWWRRDRPETRRAVRSTSVPGVLAVVAVAALAGLATRAGGGADHRETRRSGSAASQVVSRGVLEVQVPPGWSSTDRVPRLPGVTISRPVVLVKRRSRVEVVVGVLPATSQTLLPADFVKGMESDLPRPGTTSIGGRLEAYHYTGLVHPDVARLLDVYVAPTTVGTLTVACLAETVGSLLDDCWRVVSGVSVSRGRPFAPGRAAAFREVLAERVVVLDAADARSRRRLEAATTPAEQALSVADLPEVYRGAAAAGAAIAPPSPAWPHLIVQGLRQTSVAFEGLERSLRRADRQGYEEAKRLLRARRARLKQLLDRYVMSSPLRAPR